MRNNKSEEYGFNSENSEVPRNKGPPLNEIYSSGPHYGFDLALRVSYVERLDDVIVRAERLAFLHRRDFTVAPRRVYTNPHAYMPRERSLSPFTPTSNANLDLTPQQVVERTLCKPGNKVAPVTAVLWGDFHTRALLPVVDAAFAKHMDGAMFAGLGACPPLLDTQFRRPRPITSDSLVAILNAMTRAKITNGTMTSCSIG